METRTATHVRTLTTGGNTIAVLGCGFDNIFPKQNIKLFHEIIDSGGLVISEYPPETNADSKKFLERNRIVSGLSIGVLVIEAAHRSGTSVTCKFAREQGKEVFCIPHNLENLHGKGTNRLIKDGAHLVTCANDIVERLDFLKNKDFSEVHNGIDCMLESIKSSKNSIFKDDLDNLITFGSLCDGEVEDDFLTGDIETNVQNLFEKFKIDHEFQEVYELLIGPPLNFSEICNSLNRPPEFVAKALLMLEVKGVIVKNQYGYQIKNN